MMLPNLISVSVMPGCWAAAGVPAASDRETARKTAGATLLDLITFDPPRRSADFVLFLLGQAFLHKAFLHKARAGEGTGLAFSCWVSPSTQVCAGQIRAT